MATTNLADKHWKGIIEALSPMADCTILVMNESFDGPFDAVLDCGWSLFENFDSEWMPTSASEQEEKTNCNHCFFIFHCIKRARRWYVQ